MKLLSDKHLKKAQRKMQQQYPHFLDVQHIILGTDNGKGSIGIELHDKFTWITWCYGDKSFATQRELAYILHWLFEFYVRKYKRPLLYTFDSTNVLSKNSIHIKEKVWQYVPKRYMV